MNIHSSKNGHRTRFKNAESCKNKGTADPSKTVQSATGTVLDVVSTQERRDDFDGTRNDLTPSGSASGNRHPDRR